MWNQYIILIHWKLGFGGGGGWGAVQWKIKLPWSEQEKKLDLGPGGLKCLSNQSLFHAIPC